MTISTSYTVTQNDIDTNGGGDGVIENVATLTSQVNDIVLVDSAGTIAYADYHQDIPAGKREAGVSSLRPPRCRDGVSSPYLPA